MRSSFSASSAFASAAAAALLLLLAARPALAGVGGSVVTLETCAPPGGDRTFQGWSYNTGNKNVALANDTHRLWSSFWCLASGFGIGTLPSAAGGEVFTSPCSSAFALDLVADAPRTALALADGSGLCLEVAAARRGELLRLAPCASPTPDAQAFSFASATGVLLHAPSGLCVDSGSRFRACGNGMPGSGLPFCDAALAVDDRVADLVARLSFDEKVSMLATPSGGSSSLGVSPQQWWQESLHGVANNVGVAFDAPTPASTSFPQPILSACSFNRSLWRASAAAISDEVRAFANAGHSGLTLFAPNINVARDPRWGRIQETPGEDPFLSGAYAENYMRGMQEGVDPRYLKTSACCKHFAAYSLENWEGMDRYHFNAVVTDEDLAEVYLPAFQDCVEKGRSSSIMCSYNAVNGVPSCANAFLMTTVARTEWSFDGYITSDCGAVSNVLHEHGYTNSSAATFGATLPSGMDIGCDVLLVQAGAAAQAVAQGDVTAADIDAAVAHLLRVRFRLGEFDDPATQPYAQIGLEVICSAANVALARDSARQSLVLLTNPRQLLPANRSATHSVAVVGPFANSSSGINGGINYAGVPCGGAATTVADAFAAAGLATTFALGCDVACASTDGFAAAAAAAAASDLTVVVVGLDESIEDEALDRTCLTLPGSQAQLITTACAAARGPCVVALMSGGAVDLSSALPSVTGGVFYTGFMGGSGAPAFVDTVFGVSAPAGRLDQTFYPAAFVDAVSMFEMAMRPGASSFPPGTTPGRGNRFYTGLPVFDFGFGLSYTTWLVSVEGPAAVSLAASRALIARGATPGSPSGA